MPDERRNMTIDECTTSGDKDNNHSRVNVPRFES